MNCVQSASAVDFGDVESGMESPSLFSETAHERAPWWVLPVLAFCAGFAIPSAVLVTVNAQPEYQRGYAAGYTAGRKEPMDDANERVREATFNGIRLGYVAAQRGEPMPVNGLK